MVHKHTRCSQQPAEVQAGALGAAMLSIVLGKRLGDGGEALLMLGVRAASKMAHTKQMLSANSFLPFS